jgi:hypothetical protein
MCENLPQGVAVAILFFSYSHVDEPLRDQLEIHLSGLRRQGIISSWHDRRITAGTEFGSSIDDHINAADVILLLISPNFIASDYCYEREMRRALERHQKGEARVIPVILRPCDWQELPFGGLQATPTDGRPVTMWPNIDQAFLDIVTAIKRALEDLGQNNKAETKEVPKPAADILERSIAEEARSSNLRIRKRFTDLDKDRFRREGFEYIAKFFDNSLQELVRRNSTLNQAFRRVDADNFTAAAYQDGVKVCTGSVSISGRTMGSDAIEYSMTDEPRRGSMNEAIYVKADDQTLYFDALGMQTYGREKERLTFQGAAELFWEIFIQPLQS